MYVEKIQSEQFDKTSYKVVFDDKEELEEFKGALDYYKTQLLDRCNLSSGDCELANAHSLLSIGLDSISSDTNETASFLLNDVQDILTLFFYIFSGWHRNDEKLEKYSELASLDRKLEGRLKETLATTEEQECIAVDALLNYIYAAHEQPTLLKGKAWEDFTEFAEYVKNTIVLPYKNHQNTEES